MKKKIYIVSGIVAVIAMLTALKIYLPGFDSMEARTKRVNAITTYWQQVVPPGDIDSIIRKYGQPLEHQSDRFADDPSSPNHYEDLHQLDFKDINIRVTVTSTGERIVSAVIIKTAEIPVKYGLHVGVGINKVRKVLGEPFDQKRIGKNMVYTYIPVFDKTQLGKTLGYAEFIFTNYKLTRISWLTDIDD